MRSGPFTALIDPLRDAHALSFALPDPGTGAEAAARLSDLEEVFRGRRRTPRMEFIRDLSPELPGLLEERGWTLTGTVPVLACEPPQLRPGAAPAGVAIELVEPEAAPERVRDYMLAQREAFGDDEPLTDSEIERWRRRGQRSLRVAAVSGGAVVGTAMAVPPAEGVVEIVAVGTRSAHRRQGIARATTTEVTARAFAAGARLAWLWAMDDLAARVFGRAGFRRVATQVSYNR